MRRMKIFSVLSVAALAAGMAMLIKNTEVKEVEPPVQIVSEPVIIHDDPTPTVIVIQEAVKEEAKKPSAPYDFIPLEDEYQLFIEDACDLLNIDFFTVMALIESESSFNHDAVGDSGKSIGLFQINKCWHETLYDEFALDVFDHLDNVKAGLYIFATLLDKYPTELAVQCYKAGESRGMELYEEGRIIPGATAVVNRAEEMRKTALE